MSDNKKIMNQQQRGKKKTEQMKPTDSKETQIAEIQQDLVQYQQPINQSVHNHFTINPNDLPLPLINLLTIIHTPQCQPSQVIALLNKSLLQSHHLLHPEEFCYRHSHKCEVNRRNLWYSMLFETERQDGNQTENSEKVVGDRRVVDVLVKDINSIVKRNRVIEVLYYMWLSNMSNQANLHITTHLQHCLTQIFTHNPHLSNQLYSLIDSSSQLALTHLQPSHFLPFSTLLSNLTTTTASNNYFLHCLSQLSFWFSLHKDHLLPQRFCHLRYNLIAKLLEQVSEDDLVQYNNGEILANVTQGIQARLIDLKYYDAAVLVWNKLADKLGLELDQGVKANVGYFADQLLSQIAIESKQTANSSLETNNKTNYPDYISNTSDITNKDINPQTITEPSQTIHTTSQTNFKKSLITQISPSQQNISHNSQQLQCQQQCCQFSQQNQFSSQHQLPPLTLHDCLFSLRNPLRRNLALNSLCTIIQRHQDDVVLVWRQLMTLLLHPLESQCKPTLVKLFLIRPNPWIKDVAEMYFKKDLSLNEKVVFCELLQQAIDQMGQVNNSTKKNEEITNDNDEAKQFYFKRVSSKYLASKPQSPEPSPLKPSPQKTRRWGHTRILHQQKSLPSMLLITSASTNRLHQVFIELYFTIVYKLLSEVENKVVKEPILAQHLVRVMSTICQNLKTFYQKYTILEDIAQKCLEVVKKISVAIKSNSPSITTLSNPIQNLSPLILSLIQCLNKLTLCLDHHCPPLIFQSLKTTIQLLKSLDIYNIKPLIELVEANVYQNVIMTQNNNHNKQGGLSMFILK